MPVEEADVVAFEQRLERLYAAGEYPQVWREVSDPAIGTRARADAALLGPLLRALGAMVWHTPNAMLVAAPLREAAHRYGLGDLFRRVESEAVLAVRCYQMRDGGHWKVNLAGRVLQVPDSLIRLFGDRILVAPEWRAIAWRRAAAELADPMLLLTYCDCIVRYDHRFAIAMTERLVAEAPHARADIGALAAALRGAPPRTSLRRLRDGALDLAGVFLSRGRTVMTSRGRRRIPREYTTDTRLFVAQTLAAVGVTLPAAVSWLLAHPLDAPSLARHRTLLSADTALELCAVITAIFHALPPDAAALAAPPYRG